MTANAIAGGVLGLLALGGAVAFGMRLAEAPPDWAAALTAPREAPAEAAATDPTPVPDPMPASAAPEPRDPQPTPALPEAPDGSPTFDMVRIDAVGSALIAGAGRPDAEITVRLDGAPVATTRADGQGAFVALFDIAASGKARILTLEARGADGAVLLAADSIVVAPTFPPEPALEAAPAPETASAAPVETADGVAGTAGPGDAARAGAQVPSPDDPVETARAPRPGTPQGPTAAPDLGADTLALPRVTAGVAATETPARGPDPAVPADAGPAAALASAPDAAARAERGTAPVTATASAPLPDAATGLEALGQPQAAAAPGAEAVATQAPAQPAAPRLFRVGPDGLSVERAAAARPDASQALDIDVIAYDTEGRVQLAGRGRGDEELRIFLDDRPVRTTRIGPDGAWVSPLPDVDTGTYTLRVETVSADGTVTDVLETPFLRTAPEIAAQARRDGAEAITVQTGYTLWALSEGYFGDGESYVQLFEANRDQIRDPDLIYPGQIFRLPKAD